MKITIFSPHSTFIAGQRHIPVFLAHLFNQLILLFPLLFVHFRHNPFALHSHFQALCKSTKRASGSRFRRHFTFLSTIVELTSTRFLLVGHNSPKKCPARVTNNWSIMQMIVGIWSTHFTGHNSNEFGPFLFAIFGRSWSGRLLAIFNDLYFKSCWLHLCTDRSSVADWA